MGLGVSVCECDCLSVSGDCVNEQMYMHVCVCIRVHECGNVWMSVPVGVNIQVLCERLCVCIFELMGGDCALEKPQSS